MKSSKLVVLLLTLLLVAAWAGQSWADISNAAVLFLRIAPGARAAGMGEAYVAIADDATATHWNPAGLGNYPLSGSWIEAEIPAEYRPIRALATIRKGSGRGYEAYETWAVTPKGLVRFDSNEWHAFEKFQAKTTQTVESIVSSYFDVSDEKKLAEIIRNVARANNDSSLAFLTGLRDSILAAVPEDYSSLESISGGLDSLLICYDLCRLNWNKVFEAEKLLERGLKDSVLTETETDRIDFAVEKAKNRFIPETLRVPYSAYLTEKLISIASGGDFLVVSTSDGVVTYNGKNWRSFTVANGLPSGNILSLCSTGKSVLIGTDSGIVRYSGLDFASLAGSEQLPEGSVTAMGAQGLSNIWIVLNNDLYHFDGTTWSNSAPYAVAIDDTPETIAARFSLRGTVDETQKYIARFEALNRETPPLPVPVDSGSAEAVLPPADTASAVEDTTGGVDATDAEGTDITPEETLADEPESTDTTLIVVDEAGLSDTSGAPLVLTPGTVVQVPYVAEIRGAVRTIYTDLSGNVWLGTDNGVLVYDGSGWKSHGTGTTNHLTSVAGGPDTKIFAFGDGGTMLRYDDPSWSGTPFDEAMTFGDVWGSPGGDIVAVSSGGGIMRYDGDNWSEMTSGSTSDLFAVWGTSDSNIFAVGADGAILRYDGTAWAAMNSGTAASLFGVWGEPAGGAFAVGAGGIILSYDGSNWNTLSSGIATDLHAVWGNSFNDVYAVGNGGMVLHWDGTAWGLMASGTEQTLRAVWGSSANHVVAVGDDETIVEYDGTQWQSTTSESSLDLHDVWGSSAEDVFAVGEHGTILHYDGEQWRLQSSGRRVNNIDARSDRVFLATDGGVVEYDGREWRRVEVRGMERANALSAMIVDGELWLASDKKVVMGVSGQKELAFMHVKWLPELADDLYYEFLSFVNDFEGWGTLGGNVTFISYGTFSRTAEDSPEVVGEFDSFDIAFTVSYGTSLTRKLKGGVSAKFIYSRLADLGAGEELGQGTSTGFAVDFGLLYKMTDRLNWGLAITNIGPKMAYIDAAQADDLPRNFAFGFAYKLLRSDYYQFLVTSEINKILVGLDDGFSEELKQLIINSGVEFLYADIFALRGGYIYDEEGNVKTLTLGVGLTLLSKFKFDFAYIPSNSSSALANTLRVSIAVMP